MKFIIFICDRIRNGQFPRLPDFQVNEQHGKYLYQGRELTAEEFTAAAERVFAPGYRNQGFTFRPGIVAVSAAKPAPVPASPVEAPAPFRMEGKSIFKGDERIGGIFGEGEKQHLRVNAEFSDLRPEIEAWIEANNS